MLRKLARSKATSNGVLMAVLSVKQRCASASKTERLTVGLILKREPLTLQTHHHTYEAGAVVLASPWNPPALFGQGACMEAVGLFTIKFFISYRRL